MPGLPTRSVNCTLPSRLSTMRAGFTFVATAGVSGNAAPLAFAVAKRGLRQLHRVRFGDAAGDDQQCAASGRKRLACSARSSAAFTAWIKLGGGSVRLYG